MNIKEAIECFPYVSDLRRDTIRSVGGNTAIDLIVKILSKQAPEVINYLKELDQLKPQAVIDNENTEDDNHELEILAKCTLESSASITKILENKLGIPLPNKPLFKDMGTIARVEIDGSMTHYQDTSKIIKNEDENLQLLAIKKAISHSLLQATIKNQTLDAHTVQTCMETILGKKQFRGSHHSREKGQTIGVSGSVLNVDIVEAIMYEIHKKYTLQSFAKKFKMEIHHVLAGMGDQIAATSINSIGDLGQTIQEIVAELRTSRRDNFHYHNI